MKKFYVSLLGVLATGTMFAQSNVAPLGKKQSQQIGPVKPSKIIPQTKATILWSDDFDTPANWTIANNGTNVATWEFETDPAAIPVSALAPFASTTAANGFLFVNSDAANTADFDGTQIITTATNATPIDLTGQPYVKLTYQHNFRWWHDTRGVRVSGDNGATWTDFEMSNETTYSTPNQNSANPEVTIIDISSVAGGQSQVLVQFYYDDHDYWGWYWAVDDVQISVTEDYDLTLQRGYWGSEGYYGARLPYYSIPTLPVSQIAPIEFGGIVKNNGVLTQNDIVFEATSALYSGVSAPATLAATEWDTLNCLVPFTPAAVAATHTIAMETHNTADTDDYPTDNTIPSVAINVGNYVYSRDAGVVDGGSFNSGEGFEVGNIFDIYTTTNLSAIDFTVGATAVAGAEIFVKVYSLDPSTGDFVWLDESLPYILTAADLGANKTLALQNNPQLDADQAYLVVVGSHGDGGTTNDLVVATSGASDEQTSFYFDETNTTWYFTTSTPMVRMNFAPAGVEEVASNVNFNVYPNPANTNATVAFEVENESDVMINVTDLSGKSVYTNTLGSVQGAQNIDVNTSSLTSGVYMVNVSVNGSVSTQKLVVRK